MLILLSLLLACAPTPRDRLDAAYCDAVARCSAEYGLTASEADECDVFPVAELAEGSVCIGAWVRDEASCEEYGGLWGDCDLCAWDEANVDACVEAMGGECSEWSSEPSCGALQTEPDDLPGLCEWCAV